MDGAGRDADFELMREWFTNGSFFGGGCTQHIEDQCGLVPFVKRVLQMPALAHGGGSCRRCFSAVPNLGLKLFEASFFNELRLEALMDRWFDFGSWVVDLGGFALVLRLRSTIVSIIPRPWVEAHDVGVKTRELVFKA